MLATAAPAVHHRATLEVAESPDVLVRVLTTLRRRGCRVVGVDYRTSDRHREGWLEIDFVRPAGREAAVGAWVSNLVDVLDFKWT